MIILCSCREIIIKIQRIINIVKNGFSCNNIFCCYGKSFNLRRKKAQGNDDLEEEKFYPEFQERQEDFIDKGQDLVSPSQSIQPTIVVPQDIEERMDIWIKSNQEGIKEESESSILELINIKNNSPDVSYLDPEPVLYRALTENPVYQNYFSDKINKLVGDKSKSSLFVETMLAKTQGLMEEIKERESEMTKEDEMKKQKEEEKEQLRKQDPYSVAIDLPDPSLNVKIYEKFLNLSLEEKNKMYGTMRMKYNDMMLSKAALDKFSQPKEGKLDQRMNFFLKNPQFLSSIIKSDPNFQKILRRELDNAGIKNKDFEQAIRESYSRRGIKKRITNVLNNEKGQFLHQILESLINRLDPTVAEWLKGAFFGAGEEQYREQSYSQEIGEEGYTGEKDLQGLTPGEVGDLSMTEADVNEASKQISNVIKYYLQDSLDDMETLNRYSSQKIMEGASDGYNKFESLKLTGPLGKEQIKEQEAYLRQYSIAERLNAYSQATTDQLEKLFKERGKTLPKDQFKMIYKNRFGKIVIPRSELERIFGSIKEEDIGSRDIKDYKDYVDVYKKQIEDGAIKDPFSPEWKEMINYKIPLESMADLGEIKKYIYDLKRGGYNDPNAIINKMKTGRMEELLNRFANIYETDDSKTAFSKKYNFINMSLKQDPKKHLSNAFEIYKKREGINKEKIKLEQEKEKVGRKPSENEAKRIKEKEKKISEKERKEVSNLKAIMGTSYTPMLPHISDLANEKILLKNGLEVPKFSTESLRGFVDLFDHHPTKLRNFMGVGGMVNPYDKQQRTNTELYYLARREDPPSHVKLLSNIYRDGVQEFNKKLQMTGRQLPSKPSFERDSWYVDFFNKYSDLDALQRALESKEEKIEKIEKSLDEYTFYANKKALFVISDKKKMDEILNSLKDPNERVETERQIRKWDGSSRLPLNIYTLLGQKTTSKIITDRIEQVQKIKEGLTEEQLKRSKREKRKGEGSIKEIGKDINILKKELTRILQKHNYNVDLSALKLAFVAYKKAISRIYKLNKIKKSSYKFASINTISIDAIIKDIRKEYNNFFDSLFL